MVQRRYENKFYQQDHENAAADIYNIDFSNNKIDPAYPIPKGSPALGIPTSVNLGPVPFVVQPFLSLLTLDLSNMLTEYGADPGEIPSFAGATDIPPFETFHTYDYGQLDIYFQPDSGGTPVLMGSVTHGDNYSMDRFLENAGMIDLPLTAINYMQGYFYMQTGTKGCLQKTTCTYSRTSKECMQNKTSNKPIFIWLTGCHWYRAQLEHLIGSAHKCPGTRNNNGTGSKHEYG